MTNLERLKIELNNKAYFEDEVYTMFLDENGLVATATYTKADNEENLLEAVVAILQALCNDVDFMRKVDTEEIGLSTEQAYKSIELRIKALNTRIIEIKESKIENEETDVRPFFFNGTI